jgi:hypothetical protein
VEMLSQDCFYGRCLGFQVRWTEHVFNWLYNVDFGGIKSVHEKKISKPKYFEPAYVLAEADILVSCRYR